MLGKLTGWLKRRNGREAEDSSAVEKGFLVFQHTGEVIRAERCLQAAGFSVEVKGPPPELRSGCDMVVTFPLIMESAVRRVLEKERLSPLNVVPVSGPWGAPVDPRNQFRSKISSRRGAGIYP